MKNLNFIPISKPSVGQREVDYVLDAVESGWVSSLDSYIDIFEEKFEEKNWNYGSPVKKLEVYFNILNH
jgi:dTDP-4-amino-4,6-dideoxygalactose transaminase